MLMADSGVCDERFSSGRDDTHLREPVVDNIQRSKVKVRATKDVFFLPGLWKFDGNTYHLNIFSESG